MYRNKCAKCEKTRSKTRFLSWEGKSVCRKCYHGVTRNPSLHSNANVNLNAAVQGESVEGGMPIHSHSVSHRLVLSDFLENICFQFYFNRYVGRK